MKNIFCKAALVLVLFFVSNGLQAHRWVMTNKLNKAILVQVELLHSKNPYFVLVGPGGKADFNWPLGNPMAGFCLNKIKYVLPDLDMLNQRSIIRDKKEVTELARDKKEVIDNKKMLAWLEQNESKYPRHEVNLDSIFKLEKANSKNVMSISLTPEKALQERCSSRDDIVITEENGVIVFKTKS